MVMAMSRVVMVMVVVVMMLEGSEEGERDQGDRSCRF